MTNPTNRFHLLDSQLRHAYEINNRDLFDAIWAEFDSLADELNATHNGIPQPPIGTTRCSECGVWLTASETEFNSQCRYHQVHTTTQDDWDSYARDMQRGYDQPEGE